jgi:choline dehydrogenase-like flavoprotein
MSLVDARELPAGHCIKGDLCVVGAGAAGLAIASELAREPIRVVVLESGGHEPETRIQALNAGDVVGRAYAPLEATRLRCLGGTTNHWTAWVHPLDPLDFEARSWVPHSGWPFGWDELAPYYERARRFLELPERAFEVGAWEVGPQRRAWRFEGGRVESGVLQIVAAGRRRLGAALRDGLAAAARTTVHLWATALEIVPDRSGRHVRYVRAVADDGRPLTVRARHYVLATGGIENPRLLLESTCLRPEGLGNDRDLVGRFFGNHADARAGTLQLSAPTGTGFYTWHRRNPTGAACGFLRLAAPVRRAEETLGVRLMLLPERPGLLGAPGPHDLDAHVARVSAAVDQAAGGAARPPRVGARLTVAATVEQAPDPQSRVGLAVERDRLGARRVVLDWRFGDREAESLRRTVDVLARAVGASGLGRLRDEVDGGTIPFQAQSFHHMGTTRMHADPRRGVVDARCRVHGIDNLFVAGSSVFPTYGTANPTFTILALAFRLCDHLRTVLR